MQRLEVSGAVRHTHTHIYIYIYIYIVRRLKVNAVYGNNRCLFRDPHHKYTVWAEHRIAVCLTGGPWPLEG
jgi:hypothetical protein